MAAPKTSILPELRAFVANLGPDVPYDKLLATAAEAGWMYRLEEIAAAVTTDGVLVTFDVLVGRDGTFEHFDRLSIKTGLGAGPVSMVARALAVQPLIHLFFGRFPPAAPATPPAEQINVDMGRNHAADQSNIENDGGVYIEPDAERLPVVARTEPDGLPIFVDLYDPRFNGKTRAVIDAVFDEVEAFLGAATAPEQVNALALKNPELLQFIRDFGTEEDKSWFRDAAQARRAQLAPPVLATTAPRRRSGVTAH